MGLWRYSLFDVLSFFHWWNEETADDAGFDTLDYSAGYSTYVLTCFGVTINTSRIVNSLECFGSVLCRYMRHVWPNLWGLSIFCSICSFKQDRKHFITIIVPLVFCMWGDFCKLLWRMVVVYLFYVYSRSNLVEISLLQLPTLWLLFLCVVMLGCEGITSDGY